MVFTKYLDKCYVIDFLYYKRISHHISRYIDLMLIKNNRI